MTHLIPFAPEHFDTLCSWFSSESDVVQWGGTALSFPLLAADMEEMLRETRSDPPGRFCFMAQAGGCCVGHVQLVLDWRNGTARIARVAVAPDARGRGIAAEMLGQAMAKAFALPGFERLELVVYSFNATAIRLYERLGFVGEGVLRSSVRVGDERWDTVLMAQLRSEWSMRVPTGGAWPPVA